MLTRKKVYGGRGLALDDDLSVCEPVDYFVAIFERAGRYYGVSFLGLAAC